jgi:hypothetical protein
MQVSTAQRPDVTSSDDRIFVAPDAVVMLDGVSAFVPTDVPTAVYVDLLGSTLRDALADDPVVGLRNVLAVAIESTAQRLDLARGAAPASTIAIARHRPDETIDVLVLGDTQVATPELTIRDNRLANIGARHLAAHQQQLAAGGGYDEQHTATLRELQCEQLRYRNQPGGYWIAEADPDAAEQAFVVHMPAVSTPWLVLATDGAYNSLAHLALDDWPQIAQLDSDALGDLLDNCHQWEACVDPGGVELPRAKRQEDKSLAVLLTL